MEDQREVVVLSGTRTAIGKYGGGLASVPPCDLAATVVREAVSRAGVEPTEVGHAVFGNVIHTEVRDMYLSRVAAVNGGLPVETPAFTLNRLCGSGLQAIVSAAQAIKLGDCDVAVAGGAESMSRGQYWLPSMRWGQRMQDGVVIDADGGRADRPIRQLPYGCDGRERRQRVQRVQGGPGHARGGKPPAGRRGHRGRVLQGADPPVEVKGRKGTVTVDTDEHIRPGVTTDDLAKLRPVVRRRRHRDAGQRFWHQRRRSGSSDRFGVVRRRARTEPARTAGRLQPRRGRAEDHGHGSRARGPQGARPGRSQARRDRPVRGERGLRRPGPRRGP